MTGRTLYDKLWDSHHVIDLDEQSSLLYIDRQLLHEVTSPQAFAGLRIAHRPVWRIDANLATEDHNIPTSFAERQAGVAGIEDFTARLQVETLEKNCQLTQIPLFTMSDRRQGIVHVIGPELGATLPGMTIVCGDSHTSTHGAFAALAHGIGTSEVEHVLATQCLVQRKLKNMQVQITGKLPFGITAKDIILVLIGQIGTAGGTNHAIEFTGEVIDALSMEARMTLCNMAIEAGARVGLIAVDQTTINYLQQRPFGPTADQWSQAEHYWRTLHSDTDAVFDQIITLNVENIEPQVTWGTSPEMVLSVNGKVPNPTVLKNNEMQQNYQKAIDYMGLVADQPITEINIDHVFIGSCTNGRIEDLRQAAAVLHKRQIAKTIKQALVVPGSGLVKQQAEAEGLDQIFKAAGFEWREPGCSMCLAMNADKLLAGERCASTSNRNFQGRQGFGSRTHLVSPAMAAAAAIAGHFVDVRHLINPTLTESLAAN